MIMVLMGSLLIRRASPQAGPLLIGKWHRGSQNALNPFSERLHRGAAARWRLSLEASARNAKAGIRADLSAFNSVLGLPRGKLPAISTQDARKNCH
jgi:hypothetical protein